MRWIVVDQVSELVVLMITQRVRFAKALLIECNTPILCAARLHLQLPFCCVKSGLWWRVWRVGPQSVAQKGSPPAETAHCEHSVVAAEREQCQVLHRRRRVLERLHEPLPIARQKRGDGVQLPRKQPLRLLRPVARDYEMHLNGRGTLLRSFLTIR